MAEPTASSHQSFPSSTDPASTYLQRFAVKPHHVDDWLPLFAQQRELHARHGIETLRAFLETDAEPKLSWLYRADPSALEAVRRDPAMADLTGQQARHVFTNQVVRRVEPLVMTRATPESVAGTLRPEKIAIMRRYDITDGSGIPGAPAGEAGWEGFLAVWRRIVEVREKYGFGCLFAVADRPHDLFTWAFDFDGDFADFGPAQRDYYHDPARVELRGVFDFMADYSIHPARQLLV